jgi:sec-independent protein translocase protein TatA
MESPNMPTFPLLPLAWIPGPTEWIIIGVLGLLFFGRRLPEVGRSLGKGIVEFKKGLKGVEEEIETATSQSRTLPNSTPGQALPEQNAKFDPYTGKPLQPAFDPYTGKPLSESNAGSK